MAALSLAAAIAPAQSLHQEYVPGQVLVKFKDTALSPMAQWSMSAIRSEMIDAVPSIGVSVLSIPDSMSPPEAARYFSQFPNVEFAEPNGIVHTMFTPNDSLFTSQYAPQRVSGPAAWDLSSGNPGVVIAIVDTGIDYRHPDLAGKVTAGYDFVNGDADAYDDYGHGTHCAGIAAARTNNAIGIAGIGFDCSLMPVKVLGADGTGSVAGVAQGIGWATANGAKVISLSLSGPGSVALQAAVDDAWQNNVLVVAAAGNRNTDAPSYPAYYSNAIAVASTDANDRRSNFSNFGSWVDVAAPGEEILSTLPGNRYDLNSGTSMACPAVAGLGGLLWSHLGANTPISEIRRRIEANCDPVGSFVARGRVNAYRALTDAPPQTPPQKPSNPSTSNVQARSIDVHWTDNSNNETAFQVFMQVSGGEFAHIGDAPADNTGFRAQGLRPETTYRFKIRAVNAAGASAFTSRTSAKTKKLPLEAPTNLRVRDTRQTSIRLAWDHSGGASEFRIDQRRFRSGSWSGWSLGETVPGDRNAAIRDGLRKNTLYQFRIRAISGSRKSDWSAVVEARTDR